MVAHHFSRTFLCLSVLPCETDPGTVQGRNVTLGELLSYLKVTTKFSEGTKPTRGLGGWGRKGNGQAPFHQGARKEKKRHKLHKLGGTGMVLLGLSGT